MIKSISEWINNLLKEHNGLIECLPWWMKKQNTHTHAHTHTQNGWKWESVPLNRAAPLFASFLGYKSGVVGFACFESC